MADNKEIAKHFILVHGLGLGAWCWYKLKPLLESAGHRVTAIDLVASGINMEAIEDVRTFREFTKPLSELLASLPPDEKVILVGHSSGGVCLALAMDEFPSKISVGIFLSAYMPDTTHQPPYVLNKYLAEFPQEMLLDTRFETINQHGHPLTIITWGPKFMAASFYQLSPVADLELGKALVRPGSLFQENLSKTKNFSEEGYGSVKRVYVLNIDDAGILVEYQRWMVQNYPPTDVFEINGADHMLMQSNPQEVCNRLVEIANKYA